MLEKPRALAAVEGLATAHDGHDSSALAVVPVESAGLGDANALAFRAHHDEHASLSLIHISEPTRPY